MKRKLLALLLIASLGVSACSKSDSSSASSSDTSAATSVTETTETTETTTTTEATTAETTAAPMVAKYADFLSQYESFEVTSSSLHNGGWDDVISNTDKGENKSPELSWAPVEGATVYVVYMIDTCGKDWMHWKSGFITEAGVPEGYAKPIDEYMGPYPNGTHPYEVYVIALKNPTEKVKGVLNTTQSNFQKSLEYLDTDAEGNTGNIVAYGFIGGTFTN